MDVCGGLSGVFMTGELWPGGIHPTDKPAVVQDFKSLVLQNTWGKRISLPYIYVHYIDAN